MTRSSGDHLIPSSGDEPIGKIMTALRDLLASIPKSSQESVADPLTRARQLTTVAALKAAAVSGSLALPPGPLGLATILPDLYAVWRLQAELVSDIAAAYGKTGNLTQETMLFCLFKHAAAQALRDVVTRVGERVIVRRASLRAMQGALRRIGVTTTQRLLGRGVTRLLPVLGALGVAGYAYYDTGQVAKTAIDLFSKSIDDAKSIDAGPDQGRASASAPPSAEPLGSRAARLLAHEERPGAG